jgi:5-methylcytosine-specific restriction endonuclease McrA
MPFKDPEARRAYIRQWDKLHRQQMSTYHKRLWKGRRDAFFTGKVCARCGSSEDLQLDHIDATTKDPKLGHHSTDNDIWRWSEERRASELAKCQVLCAPCNRQKQTDEGELPHGETHWNVKLTDQEVREIRASSATVNNIARQYGVSHSLISMIRSGGRRTKTPG